MCLLSRLTVLTFLAYLPYLSFFYIDISSFQFYNFTEPHGRKQHHNSWHLYKTLLL